MLHWRSWMCMSHNHHHYKKEYAAIFLYISGKMGKRKLLLYAEEWYEYFSCVRIPWVDLSCCLSWYFWLFVSPSSISTTETTTKHHLPRFLVFWFVLLLVLLGVFTPKQRHYFPVYLLYFEIYISMQCIHYNNRGNNNNPWFGNAMYGSASSWCTFIIIIFIRQD